jgi:predicted transposase/invertase (TIGR01784 family)
LPLTAKDEATRDEDHTNIHPDIETPGAPDKKNFDYDGFWKDLIERFFYPLLKRALPELYEEADKSVAPRFLDKEFRDILNTSDPKIHTSPHFADYVAEVPLENGSAEWVITHIESQRRGGGNLAERMSIYRSLIFVHYQREPAALAIIADKRPTNEPKFYSHSRYGTRSVYEYNMLELLELDDDELLASDNPIDIVLYAAKFAMKTKEESRKFNFLRKAVSLLNDRGWSMEEKRDLLLFLERIVNMRDETLITQYREILEQESREGKAMYIPLIMRDSAAEIEQRGIEKGREEGRLEVARKLLARGISPDIIVESAGVSLDQVRGLMN